MKVYYSTTNSSTNPLLTHLTNPNKSPSINALHYYNEGITTVTTIATTIASTATTTAAATVAATTTQSHPFPAK